MRVAGHPVILGGDGNRGQEGQRQEAVVEHDGYFFEGGEEGRGEKVIMRVFHHQSGGENVRNPVVQIASQQRKR